MSYGVIRFNWREANGDITNWWSGDLGRDQKRFVHTEWGKFAVAVDLRRREAQIQFNEPPEWRVIKFAEIPNDENIQLAFEAVVETGEHAGFATELFLRAIGRDDLADKITKDGRPAQ
jgi:hypothetical protein